MSDRRRIAVVAACPLPWPRGTPIRIHRLSEALAARGHDVHLVTYHLGERTSVRYTLHRIPRVPFYQRHAPGPSLGKLLVLDPLLCGRLRQTLRSMDFDVIHAHHYEGLLAALLADRGSLPLVYDAHTILESELPSYLTVVPERLVSAAGRWIDRGLPGKADRIIAVTEQIRSHLVESGAGTPDRTVAIGNGVDVDRFRARRPADSGRSTIVYAGNLAPYQRIDLLIAAFNAARERRRDLTLVVATDNDTGPVRRMAREYGVADGLVFERSDGGKRLPALFARAHLAVNPRLKCDGVPQKNLNYMAAGLPIVAFSESAVPTVPGETGIVVPGDDPGALGMAIATLIDDEETCRRMGEKGRELVRREMSWDIRAAQVEEVYSRLLVESRRSRSSD